MTHVEIRQTSGEEMLNISHFLAGYAFTPTPPMPDLEEWRKDLSNDDALHISLFEDGKPMADVVSSVMIQNVRGQLFEAGGIWGVATHPAARRKGYARQALHKLLEAQNERGAAFSLLYPFRESFYDRLGYTNFPAPRKVRFSPNNLLGLLKKEMPGEVEMLPIKEGINQYWDYLQKRQARLHGMGLFRQKNYLFLGERNKQWLALARVDGETVGAMLYQLKALNPANEDEFEMWVPRFFYDNSQGLYLLLEWFARHADQVRIIQVKVLPGDWPEIWWPDLKPEMSAYEPAMGRIVNLNRLGGLQTGPGSFSVQIVDSQCPWNAGCYQFETVENRLQVRPATQADCTLSIQALNALVYGTHDPDYFEIRGWGEPPETLKATLRTMFPPLLPYLHETF